MDIGNEEVGKPVADYFGITGDAPKVTYFLYLLFWISLFLYACLTCWGTSILQIVMTFFLQILGYVASEETKKYVFDGEVILEKIKVEITIYLHFSLCCFCNYICETAIHFIRHLGRILWKTSSNHSINQTQFPRMWVFAGSFNLINFYVNALITFSPIFMLQNDGDIKIVVGNNFDDIVLDESKDVLLEVVIFSYFLWWLVF